MGPPTPLQIRPRNPAGDQRQYAPQRDLAYVYPDALREAFESLDKSNWMGYYAPLLEDAGITERDLGEAAEKFAQSFELFLRHPGVESLDDALIETGFLSTAPLVRMLIFDRVGEVCTAAFFWALRDTTFVGELAPQTNALADATSAMRAFARRLNGTPVAIDHTDPLAAIDALRFRLQATEKALLSSQASEAEARAELAKTRKALRAEIRYGWAMKLWRSARALFKRS